MEVTPVTYKTFRTFFLDKGPSISSIFRLFRDFTFTRGLHSKIAMGFILLNMAFVLGFPTMAGAMTGYSGNVQAFVPDQSNNLIGFSNFSLVNYVIQDGLRVNRTQNYLILGMKYKGERILFSTEFMDVDDLQEHSRYCLSIKMMSIVPPSKRKQEAMITHNTALSPKMFRNVGENPLN